MFQNNLTWKAECSTAWLRFFHYAFIVVKISLLFLTERLATPERHHRRVILSQLACRHQHNHKLLDQRLIAIILAACLHSKGQVPVYVMNSREEWRSWQACSEWWALFAGCFTLLGKYPPLLMAKEAGCPAEPTVTMNFTLWFQSAIQTGNMQIHLVPKVDRTVKWRCIEHK